MPIRDHSDKNQIEIYQTQDRRTQIEVRFDQDTVWLSQQQMADLFKQTKQNISLHIGNIFKEKEPSKKATVKESLTVRKEGKREISRSIEYYSLDVIISVGYRVKSHRGTQFRIWATQRLKEHLVQGYTLNEKRLKQLSSNLSQLEKTVQCRIHSFFWQRAKRKNQRKALPAGEKTPDLSFASLRRKNSSSLRCKSSASGLVKQFSALNASLIRVPRRRFFAGRNPTQKTNPIASNIHEYTQL